MSLLSFSQMHCWHRQNCVRSVPFWYAISYLTSQTLSVFHKRHEWWYTSLLIKQTKCKLYPSMYTGGQVIPYPLFSGKHFYCFKPLFLKITETNDTSFENPNKKLLESGKKFGVASPWGWPHPLNWKSTTFTRTRVEPLMTEILQLSNIFSIATL